MQTDVSALVAYVAGRLVTGKSSGGVYDYGQGRHVSISGRVDSNQVAVHDYATGSSFGGSGARGQFNLYHYGYGRSVTIQVSGHRFTGHDYGAGSSFSGTVSGQNISLYDYGTGTYREYSL
jgi:hypothetical protein